ncbi:hypothetical protein [Thiorhodococcus minor]|uniref:Uncharacterized protein n=1 Tax=Thiorhodococcus minor TaxID=57489 RepID=A0A6M0K0T8_9GAMM|nr:hypothetical protein [Thiorhodococcus minor]NEV62217.1 hypothetical protein [Thiorhodococcus minor]
MRRVIDGEYFDTDASTWIAQNIAGEALYRSRRGHLFLADATSIRLIAPSQAISWAKNHGVSLMSIARELAESTPDSMPQSRSH